MEDVGLVRRIGKERLVCLPAKAITSAERYKKTAISSGRCAICFVWGFTIWVCRRKPFCGSTDERTAASFGGDGQSAALRRGQDAVGPRYRYGGGLAVLSPDRRANLAPPGGRSPLDALGADHARSWRHVSARVVDRPQGAFARLGRLGPADDEAVL